MLAMYAFYKHAACIAPARWEPGPRKSDTLWREWSSRLEVLYFHQQHRLFLRHNLHVGRTLNICFHLGWSQNITIQERAKRQCPFSITIWQQRRSWQPQILCWSGGPRHLRDIFIPLSQARLSRQNQFNWLKACLLACLVGHFFVLTITMWCHVYCTLIPVYMSTVEPRCNQCNVVHRVHGKDHIFSWNVLFQYRLHALCNA